MIGDVLWTPSPEGLKGAEIGRFTNWLREHRGRDFGSCDELWHWSVEDLDGFWSSIWEFFGIRARLPYGPPTDKELAALRELVSR